MLEVRFNEFVHHIRDRGNMGKVLERFNQGSLEDSSHLTKPFILGNL